MLRTRGTNVIKTRNNEYSFTRASLPRPKASLTTSIPGNHFHESSAKQMRCDGVPRNRIEDSRWPLATTSLAVPNIVLTCISILVKGVLEKLTRKRWYTWQITSIDVWRQVSCARGASEVSRSLADPRVACCEYLSLGLQNQHSFLLQTFKTQSQTTESIQQTSLSARHDQYVELHLVSVNRSVDSARSIFEK